jgi:hypothetical protein
MKTTIKLTSNEIKNILSAMKYAIKLVNMPTLQPIERTFFGIVWTSNKLSTNKINVDENKLTYYYNSIFFGHIFGLSENYSILRDIVQLYSINPEMCLNPEEVRVLKPYLDACKLQLVK